MTYRSATRWLDCILFLAITLSGCKRGGHQAGAADRKIAASLTEAFWRIATTEPPPVQINREKLAGAMNPDKRALVDAACRRGELQIASFVITNVDLELKEGMLLATYLGSKSPGFWRVLRSASVMQANHDGGPFFSRSQ